MFIIYLSHARFSSSLEFSYGHTVYSMSGTLLSFIPDFCESIDNVGGKETTKKVQRKYKVATF